MQALFDTNLPKFLKEDLILFQNLMSDLFPHSSKGMKKQEAVERAVRLAITELNFQPWPSQIEKVIKLNLIFSKNK
jgi:dynein heavy chain